MTEQARFGFVINLDVQDSGRLPDDFRPAMRAELYRVTREALQQARVADSQVHREDRGDGILLVIAPTVAPQQLLGPWLEHLYQNLRSGNRHARHVLRLRVGMHAGPVTADPYGRSGRAVDLACRLGNCEEAKLLLRTAPAAPLLVALSDSLYREWVGAGAEWIDPAHYRAQRVRLPEGDQTAWFRLRGVPGPGPAPTGVEPERDRERAPGREPEHRAAPGRAPAAADDGLVVSADGYDSGLTIAAESIERIGGGEFGKEPAEVQPVRAREIRSVGRGSGTTIAAGRIGSINFREDDEQEYR
ncbi:hypothetical protein ACFYNO_11510 [Kitasatospora sp. NPDC006697]|uniref:hypothetical protein n=1 Tax=Kitasatospora sp. NPDC006697 TaxID=3364020 RepID=UPI0036C9B90C